MATISKHFSCEPVSGELPAPGSRWDFITCEFPPEVGGLADYTRLIAEALARYGAQVEIWAPGVAAPENPSGKLTVQRGFGRFRPGDLLKVSRVWKAAGVRRNMFLQWTPTGYGYKSLNIFICLWLAVEVARGHRLFVMFHEFAYSFSEPKLRLKIAGVVHRLMALILLSCARKAFVSAAEIGRQLQNYNFRRRDITVLPVPSNVPESADLQDTCAIRSAFVKPGELLVGHFGLYHPGMERILTPSLNALFNRNPNVKLVLIGSGSELYRSKFFIKHPEHTSRLLSTGGCDLFRIAQLISACDCMFQPYPDGLTTKRTSAMAAIANGKLLVCTASEKTEDIWKATEAVHLINSSKPSEIAEELDFVLSVPERLLAGSAQASRFYRQNFSVEQTAKVLQAGMET